MPLPVMMFIALIPVLLWAFFTWDSLVKFEYEQFHQHWVDDGEPSGMFWRPPEFQSRFRSGWSAQKYMFVWLFMNPEWAELNDDAFKLLRRYRVLVLIWNFGVIALWCILASVGF